MSLDEAYAIRDDDGLAVGDELRRIGYAGELEPGGGQAHAYLELHIEQGPILDAEGGGIGAVTGVQASPGSNSRSRASRTTPARRR